MVAEVPGAPGRLRFTHALIRDSLYESIPASQCLRLHQSAGEALEALYAPDLRPHLAELAHHFFEAAAGGGAGMAAGYAERAGHHDGAAGLREGGPVVPDGPGGPQPRPAARRGPGPMLAAAGAG
jgi:hypothetical protein